MRQLRWAFHVGSWKPTRQEWEVALSSIQPEEVARIQKFLHQSDVKAALAGRVLLRRAGCILMGLPWREVHFGRTDRGKPYLINQSDDNDCLSVNISHHGDYTVLAASDRYQLGVDVMQTKWPLNQDGSQSKWALDQDGSQTKWPFDQDGSQTKWPSNQDGGQHVDRFFYLMRRKFTKKEWRTINQGYDLKDKLFRFHRHWCLKESYIKAIGIGIHFDLKRIEFHIQSNLNTNCIINDTKMTLDGKLQKNWLFEETMLDSTHCVSTAFCSVDEETHLNNIILDSKFIELTFAQITENAQLLGHDIPKQSYERFLSLEEKPGRSKS